MTAGQDQLNQFIIGRESLLGYIHGGNLASRLAEREVMQKFLGKIEPCRSKNLEIDHRSR